MRCLPLFGLMVSFCFILPAQDTDKEDEARPVCVMKTSMGSIHLELFADEAPKTVANFIGLAEGTKEFTDPSTDKKAKRPYYDNLIFHRVIDGFMVQGGCPLGSGSGGPGYKFEDEINADDLGMADLKAMTGGRPHPWLLCQSQQDVQRNITGPLIRKMGIKNEKDFNARRGEYQRRLEELTLKDVYTNQGYQYNSKLKSHKPNKGVIAMANSGPNTNGSQFFINLDDTSHLTGKHTVFGRVIKGMEIVEAIGKVKVGPGSKPGRDVRIISIRKVK